MLFAATAFIVLEFLVNTILEAREIYPRSVNVDLETVFSFKENEKTQNIKLLDRVQNFISDVKDKVEGNYRNNGVTSGRRHLMLEAKGETTFVDLIIELIEVLKSFKDDDLQDAFAIADDEIKKYHYKGCKFHELMSNQDIRKFLRKYELLKTLPGHIIRERLDRFSALLNDKSHSSIINYINSMYKADDVKEFKYLLRYFKGYQNGIEDTNELIDLVRDTVRRMLFDHYSSMNNNTRRALKAKLEALLWKDAERTQNVQHLEWTIEYTAPTPDDLRALRETTTTKRDISNNMNLNFQMENQFEFQSVEKVKTKPNKKHKNDKKNKRVPKQQTENESTDKTSSLEFNLDSEDHSESKDETIGVTVDWGDKNEQSSDVSSVEDITTKKYHKNYKYTTPFYMEQTSKEYKPRKQKFKGFTNGNIGRSHNKPKDALRDSFSQDITFANKKKHHRKLTSKSTTDITTNAYKTKKPHAGHHSKASNKKKEKYVPKTRDVIGPKRENHKFSMHSYLKTVHFDGEELKLKLAESESEDDDKTGLRMPQEKKSHIVIIQKPQTTKSSYTTTQKRGSVTPTYEESSDDSSHVSEVITKVTKEPVVKTKRKTDKERESSTESKSGSELETNIQDNISKATKNISVRKDHEKSSEESQNQNLSNDIDESPLRMPKTKHKIQKITKTKIDTSSTNSESAKENSENDETLLTGKQPIRFDEMSHEEKNSSNHSEESTKTTIKSVNERAQEKKTDDSSTSSESEVEKSLNEETYINSINERGSTKQTEKTSTVTQTTAELVTDKNPNNLYDESQDSSESNEVSTKDFKMTPMQKTYETKSPKDVYQPLSAELNGEIKTNQNSQKIENIDNTQGTGQYSVNIVIEKATEQILTKENPVEKQISESISSDEKQISTEDESLDGNVKHAAEPNIIVKTTTPKDNIKNSEEMKDYSQEATNPSSNEFETPMDQSFNQKWSVKKTMTNQASINQQLQSNNDNHRSRKQNEVLNSPVPETLTTIRHTNIFNYGNMTKDVIKKKILDVMRKRNQMINEYNDPHMPLHLMQNYGIDKKSDEMDDAQLSNAYNEDQESFNSHLNQKLMAKIEQYRARKSNMNMVPVVIEKQTTYKEDNKLYHDNTMEQHINNKNVHLLKQHDNAFKYNKPQYLEKVENPDEYHVIGKVNIKSLEENVSNENKSRRSIHNNNKSKQQNKKEPMEVSYLQEEVMQTSERNLRRNEYEHGSSAELFQNLSDMKKHLNNNKYSKFNPNAFISTEFTETANTQLKPAEFEHDNNSIEQKNGYYLTEKSATTMSVYETQENSKAYIYTSTSIPNFEQTVANFQSHEIDNVEDMSPIQQESTNTFEKRSETTTTYVNTQGTRTTEPIEKVISNMEVFDIIEKQSWILDHKGNITETDKATTTSFIPMSTYNITENPNIDLNKTTRSYIVLSDFIKSQPVKLDLDNEITRSKEPQNMNQDFRRHKMGNRAKMKQLQQMYKTMYPMETTKTEPLSTTKVKPTITTRVTTTSPSTEPTTIEAITDSNDTTLLSSTKEDPGEVQTVLTPEFATLVRTHIPSTMESSTTTKKNTRSTKKKRRRRTRRRRTSTTISNNTELSTVPELSTTTIENTKSSPEYSVATDIGTIHSTEPTSTYTDMTKTTSPITVNYENTKELLKIDLESSETTPNTETISELTETSKPITAPDISKETIKTTNKSVDTEYRKSNTIHVKKDNTPITMDTTEYRKSNTVEDLENTPAKEDFTPEDDYNLLLQRANDNNTYADVTDMDYHAIPLKNDTNRIERLEMIEKLNLQPEENDTEFGLKDAIALADSVKPQHNLETELRVEKSRLLLNKDMLRLYGHTISAMTFPSTLPSNTLYTDPFDPLMPGGLDLGLGLL